METKFTLGIALKIIFKYIQSPPTILAEQYVDRDRTLVYKWIRGTASPPKRRIPDIIRFVTECSDKSVQDFIRVEMDRHISESELNSQFKKILDEKSDFSDYLESIFSMLVAEKALVKSLKHAEITTPTNVQNESDIPYSAEMPESSPEHSVFTASENAIHIRLTYTAIMHVVFALLAAISVEILWGTIAYTLRLPYVPESLYNGTYAFPIFLRGFSVMPVVVFAMFSLRKESPFIQMLPLLKKLAYIGCYALAGGIGALLPAASKPENFAQNFIHAPALLTAFLIFINALVFSFFPLLMLLMLLRFPRITAEAFLFLEFCPALLCVAVALPNLLSVHPSTEQVWLGGFFPCFVLSVLMFVSVRLVFKGHTDTIKLYSTEIPQA